MATVTAEFSAARSSALAMTCVCYPSYRPRAGATMSTTSTSPSMPAWLRRLARRALVAAVGGAALVAGVVMLVLPGPGLVTIALGFGVLGREFAWAARVNARARERLSKRLLKEH